MAWVGAIVIVMLFQVFLLFFATPPVEIFHFNDIVIGGKWWKFLELVALHQSSEICAWPRALHTIRGNCFYLLRAQVSHRCWSTSRAHAHDTAEAQHSATLMDDWMTWRPLAQSSINDCVCSWVLPSFYLHPTCIQFPRKRRDRRRQSRAHRCDWSVLHRKYNPQYAWL